MIQWRGNETVLDIGTGRGLLAIGAAKRLRTGTVTAIDIWTPRAAGNTLETAQRNIEIEGMQDSVELRSGDARDIGFVDNSFDAVLCLLGLHCLERRPATRACLREIARVLKPRGIAIVADTCHAESYARAFREAGLAAQEPKFYTSEAFIGLSVVIARKR